MSLLLHVTQYRFPDLVGYVVALEPQPVLCAVHAHRSTREARVFRVLVPQVVVLSLLILVKAVLTDLDHYITSLSSGSAGCCRARRPAPRMAAPARRAVGSSSQMETKKPLFALTAKKECDPCIHKFYVGG